MKASRKLHPLWPVFWLLGFRVWNEGGTAYVKFPRWVPGKQRLAEDLAASIRRDVRWR